MSLTPEQCRAGRGLLDWTQEELAERAGVSRGTVRGFESGRHELHRGSAALIRGALEAAGVLLIDADDEAGAGVRLRGRAGHPPGPRPAPSPGRAAGRDVPVSAGEGPPARSRPGWSRRTSSLGGRMTA